MTTDDEDVGFLVEAVALSRSRREAGHGRPFGAVMARDGKVLAGFDDAIISDEVPKAPLERVIPTRHLLVAKATFHAWAEKTDKVSH